MNTDIAASYPQHCERCGKLLDNERIVWLELNQNSGRYHEDGMVPEEESQGSFPFGPDCAAAVMETGGRLKRIGAAK